MKKKKKPLCIPFGMQFASSSISIMQQVSDISEEEPSKSTARQTVYESYPVLLLYNLITRNRDFIDNMEESIWKDEIELILGKANEAIQQTVLKKDKGAILSSIKIYEEVCPEITAYIKKMFDTAINNDKWRFSFISSMSGILARQEVGGSAYDSDDRLKTVEWDELMGKNGYVVMNVSNELMHSPIFANIMHNSGLRNHLKHALGTLSSGYEHDAKEKASKLKELIDINDKLLEKVNKGAQDQLMEDGISSLFEYYQEEEEDEE